MFNGIGIVLTHRKTLLLLFLCAALSSSYEGLALKLVNECTGSREPIDRKRLIKLLERKISKSLSQTESGYAVPCVFLREEKLIMLPNTLCKDLLGKRDKTVLIYSLRGMAKLICKTTFRYGEPPYESMDEVEWAKGIHHDHLLKSYEVIDAPLELFSDSKLNVGDFICGVKRALLEGGYVRRFMAELNTKASEIRASISRGRIKHNVAQIRAECESCRMYTSSITAKSMAMSLREQEICCKVFAKAFPDNEDGLSLLIEIYNSPAHSDSSALGCKIFDISSSNIEKIFDLCEGYGEDVAAGALKMCLLDPDTELDLDAEYIRTLIEKETRRREANADELVKPAAGKKKTGRRAKKAASSEEEDVPSTHEEPAEKKILEIRPDDGPERRVTRYRLLRRVRRWGGPLEAIRRSLECSKDRRHRGQKMEEIRKQKDLHDLADAVHVLEEDDAADYFFRTERGVSALATLEVGERAMKGVLEIGLRDDGHTVYHLMFNPRRVRMEKVLIPEFEDGEDVAEGRSGDLRSEMWCRITRTGGCYVLTYTDPFEESQIYKKLVLHPYRARRFQ